MALHNTDGGVLLHRMVPALEKVHGDPGSTDTFSFHGLDLGIVDTVWMAPEQGTWGVEEIWLDTEFQKARFLRDMADPEGVVFRQAPLSLTLDVAKHADGMRAYETMKFDILVRIMGLTVVGCTLLHLQEQDPCVAPFAAGATAGLLYQRMLQHDVDMVGQQGNLFSAVYSVLNSMATRLGVVGASTYFLFHNQPVPSEDVSPHVLLWAFAGFMLNKLALWSVLAKSEKN